MATETIRRTGRVAEVHHAAPSNGREVNVGDRERLISLLGGGGAVAYGLTRGTLGGLALAALGGGLLYRGGSGHCSAYAALGLNTARPRDPRASVAAGRGIKVDKSITILREPAELYAFWRDFENLARVMDHIESVRADGDNRWHWVARGPMGRRVEWNAEVVHEREHEVIAWRSLEGSEVDTAGSVHFTPAPADRGTEVQVVLRYDPPAGKAGAAAAWLLGEAPGQQIQEDLRRFKQIMEAGTSPTIEGQPKGRCGA